MSEKRKCSYCGKPILKDEAMVEQFGEKYHLSCSIEEQDGFDVDNEHGDS